MVIGAWVVVVVAVEKGDGGAGVASRGGGGVGSFLLESPVTVVTVVAVVAVGGGLTNSALSSFCTLSGASDERIVSVYLVRTGMIGFCIVQLCNTSLNARYWYA